jgi:galactokinase
LFSRAPGRVNVIGEHTDYSLLPVLPLAIDRAVLVAAGQGVPGRIAADSLTEPGPITINREVESVDGWHHYLGGVLEVLDWSGRGADLLIGGDLPSTGGLSSSSALSVGLIAAFDQLWSLGLGREGLIDRAVRSERRLGVESGSMDQTVITLAEEGAALRIDFDPPSVRAVPLPEELAIVAAYSGTASPKGGSALDSYNEKVAACRAAAVLIGHRGGVDVGNPPTLSRVARMAGVERLVDELPVEASASLVASLAGCDPEIVTRFSVGGFDPDRPLPIQVSARHVLSEAARVDRAEEALANGDLVALGALLDASHRSLQEFGASTAALDRLVEAMRASGAYGSRLTGAGFGGYGLAACPVNRAEQVLAAAVAATGGPAFRVRASAGARVFRP